MEAGHSAFHQSHIFDPSEKITSVEVRINSSENRITRIGFYHNEERLVAMGLSDDWLHKWGGRSEVFDIADDEQLIGCELEHDGPFFRGITWLKWKPY